MKMLPIRVRMTIWYSLMFATAALLLSLTSWWMLRRTIEATIHQDFQERIDDLRMQLTEFVHQPTGEPIQVRLDAIYHFRDDGKWLQVLDSNGAWVYRSPRMIATGARLAPPNALVSSGVVSEFQQGTRHVRTFSSVVFVEGTAYAVELGASVNKQQVLLKQFGLELLILTPLVLLAAVAAGHSMSRKALQPVTQLALKARSITDRNLDLRLPVSATNDEISHLSTTLNNMLARIDAGYRSVRDFTANASHELRTPLARLRTEVEVALLRTRSNDEYVQTLLQVQRSAEEMTRLTETLLTLARAEAESATLILEPLDLAELVASARDEWAAIADHLSLSLTTERSGITVHSVEEAVNVLGDRHSLARLLRILLDNACKFTPSGGSIVIVLDLSESFATVSVRDSGIGIPAPEHGRIFERFYRVNGDKDSRNRGSGLGLSLAAWIAEQHRTEIVLESAIGAGSCFKMALRRAAGIVPSDQQPGQERDRQDSELALG